MRKTTRFYPRVQVDTTGCAAVRQAGGVLLTDTIRAAGLDRALSEALARWRKPTAVHDPAEVVLDLAVSLALGGDCLADVAVLRAEPGLFGPVASDPTISRTIDALAADAATALAAIEVARVTARARVWGRPDTQPGHRSRSRSAPSRSAPSRSARFRPRLSLSW